MPLHRRVQRIGEGITKDLSKIRVLELRVEVFYDFLDGRRCELAAIRVWALRRESERAIAVGLAAKSQLCLGVLTLPVLLMDCIARVVGTYAEQSLLFYSTAGENAVVLRRVRSCLDTGQAKPDG